MPLLDIIALTVFVLCWLFYEPMLKRLSIGRHLNSNMTSPVVCEYVSPANPVAAYEVIKIAGKLLLTHLYNNRSDTTEKIQHAIPFGVSTLLRPYKPLVM